MAASCCSGFKFGIMKGIMKYSYKPLIVAICLVFVGLASKIWVSQGSNNDITQVGSILSQSSGNRYPSPIIDVAQAENGIDNTVSAAVAQDGAVVAGNGGGQVANMANEDVTGALRDPGQPIGSASSGAQAIQYTANSGSLPNFNSYFIMPAHGYDEGVLGNDNSVEIENSCGTAVIAAAGGVVVPDNNIENTANGWNDGYGTFVLVEHPFGNEIFTRYAHLTQTSVSVGDYVKQGQQIGLIGQTGNANTCELGFEVIGAKNPFGH